jgi:hypothetical protein
MYVDQPFSQSVKIHWHAIWCTTWSWPHSISQGRHIIVLIFWLWRTSLDQWVPTMITLGFFFHCNIMNNPFSAFPYEHRSRHPLLILTWSRLGMDPLCWMLFSCLNKLNLDDRFKSLVIGKNYRQCSWSHDIQLFTSKVYSKLMQQNYFIHGCECFAAMGGYWFLQNARAQWIYLHAYQKL